MQATTIDEMKVIITAQTQDFNQKLNAVNQRIDRLNRQASGISSTTKKLSGTFSKFAGVVAAAFSVRAIVNFGKATSELARSAEANLQRVNDIFGSAGNSITAFAEANRTALGMSRSDVYQYAATYGNLFSTFMTDQQANAEMTQAYLNATAVVASKTGRTVEDVAERMRSGLLGNTEAIEDLGINVNIKTIEITDAFRQIADGRSWDQLNAYEQAQVRQLAILEQATKKYGTTVAQNSSFAFQQASAAIRDFQTIVGNLLNTFLVPLVNWFTGFLNQVNSLLEALFGKQTAQQNQSAQATQDNADAMEELAGQTEAAEKAAKGATASFDELNILNAESTGTNGNSNYGNSIPSVNQDDQSNASPSKWEILADKIKIKLHELMNHPFVVWLKEKFADAVQFANEQLSELADWLETLKEPFKELADKLQEAADKLWEFLEPLADQAWDEYKNTIDGIRKALQKIITVVVEVYNKFLDLREAVLDFLDTVGVLDMWQKQLSNIISFVSGIIQTFVTWIGEKTEEFKLKFGGVIDFLTGVFSGDWEKAFNGLQDTFQGFQAGIDADVGLFRGIFGKITAFLNETWENVKTFFQTALAKTGEFFNALPQKLGYLLGQAAAKVTQWGSDMIQWAKTKPKEIIDNILKFFRELPGKIKDIWNEVIEFLNKLPGKMLTLGKNLLTGIWNGILSVKDWLFQKISDFFGGFLDGFFDGMGLGQGQEATISPIPKLARGGVISAPTVAMVGEYTGASSNPEIVSPQSTMRETFLEAVMPLVDAILSGDQEIIQAIEGKDLTVRLGDRDISLAAQRGSKARGYAIAGGYR